jgi:hypothetical protein
MKKRRLNLFLADGGGWSGLVEWTDDEERERLAEVTNAAIGTKRKELSFPRTALSGRRSASMTTRCS